MNGEPLLAAAWDGDLVRFLHAVEERRAEFRARWRSAPGSAQPERPEFDKFGFKLPTASETQKAKSFKYKVVGAISRPSASGSMRLRDTSGNVSSMKLSSGKLGSSFKQSSSFKQAVSGSIGVAGGPVSPECSPLLAAALHEQAQFFEELLGAVKDPEGHSCLHVVCYRGHLALLEALLNIAPDAALREAAVNRLSERQQRAPLHYAAQRDHVELVSVLLAAGAEPASADLNGYSPLHLAVQANALLTVELFASKGLPIDSSTCSGLTPLLLAARDGKREIAFRLAGAGADICKRSTLHDGLAHLTPFLIATKAGWGEELRVNGAAPEKPLPPFIVQQTDEEAVYNWHQPAGRSAPVEHYRLQVRRVDRLEPDLPWVTVAENVRERNHSFFICKARCSSFARDAAPQDLLPGEVYTVRVLAYSIVGWSLPSDASHAICTAPAAPCTPDAPVVTGVTNTSVSLRWVLPESNGAPIQYSEVQWRLKHTEWADWSTMPVRIPAERRGGDNSDEEPSSSESDTDEEENELKSVLVSTYTVAELAPGTWYAFRIRCHNISGWSYFSESCAKVQTVTQHGERRKGYSPSAGSAAALESPRVARAAAQAAAAASRWEKRRIKPAAADDMQLAPLDSSPRYVVKPQQLSPNSNLRKMLYGAQRHAENRFVAVDRARFDVKVKQEMIDSNWASQQEQRRHVAAAVVIQTFLRAKWTRLKFRQYLYDREERWPFLVQYGIEAAFFESWRKLLLRFKEQALAIAREDRERRDAKRRRKMERRVRRERRQLVRRRRAAERELKPELHKPEPEPTERETEGGRAHQAQRKEGSLPDQHLAHEVQHEAQLEAGAPLPAVEAGRASKANETAGLQNGAETGPLKGAPSRGAQEGRTSLARSIL